jgi:hypothetical protein
MARCSVKEMMSSPPITSNTKYHAIAPTPTAVRIGVSLGRWSSWCMLLSLVIHCSRNGQRYSSRIIKIGTTSPAQNEGGIVYFPIGSFQPGIRRSAPMKNAAYQSGWASLETTAGSHGP